MVVREVEVKEEEHTYIIQSVGRHEFIHSASTTRTCG